MPGSERIDSIYNVAALKKEQKAVIQGLQESKAGIVSLSKSIEQFKSSNFATLAKNTDQLTKATIQANKATQQTLDIALRQEKLRQQQLRTQQEEIRLTQLQTKEQERLNKARAAQTLNVNIPSTSNIDSSGNIIDTDKGRTTGVAVSEAELAATQAQLQAQAELNAAQQQSATIATEATTEQQAYVNILEQQNAAIDKNISELESYASILSEGNKSLNEIAPATEVFVGTIEKNQTALSNIKQELIDNKIQQSALNTEMQESIIITEEQEAQMNALKTQEISLNDQAKVLTKTIQLQIKEMNAGAGSIDQLRARLTNLQAAYERLSAEAKISDFGKRLKSQIDILEPSVKQAEGELGKFQRNVGNYTGGLSKFFKGAFSQIRTLANILPGIGLAGLFGLAFEGISKLIDKISSGTEKIDTFAENLKNMNDVMADADKNAGKEIVNLRILYEAATNAALSTKDRTDAAIALQKTYPETFKNFSAEEIELGKAKTGYDNLTLAILQTARAKSAKDKLDQLEAQRLDIAFQKQKIINATTAEANKAEDKKTLLTVQTPGTGETKLVERVYTKAQQLADINNRKMKALGEQNLKDQSLLQQEQFLINFVGEKNLTKVVVDETKHRGDAKKKFQDTDFDILKASLEQQIADLQDFVDNGSILFKERFEAAREEAQKEMELSDAIFAHDIKAGKNRQLALIEQQNRTIDIAKKTQENITKITQDRSKDLFPDEPLIPPEAIKEAEDKHREFLDTLLKQIEYAGKNRDDIIDEQFANESAATKNAYAKGEISKEKYEKKLKDLSIKYGKETLEAEIHNMESRLSLLDPMSNEYQTLATNIAKAKDALAGLNAEGKDTGLDKLLSDLEKANEVVGTFTQALTTINDIKYDNQKAALDELSAQQEKAHEQEIANINASSLSEQEKAAKLIQADAKFNAQQTENARKQREADNAKARFDKAANIANIITSTAAAVIKGLISGGIPLALTYGALGAAQLAAAIATKVPQYKHGLHSDKPSHFGIHGEAGAELVMKPNEDAFISDRPTLDFLPRGTRIKPLKGNVVDDIMNAQLIRGFAVAMQTNKTDESLAVQKKMLKALQRRPSIKNNIVIDDKRAIWKYLNIYRS